MLPTARSNSGSGRSSPINNNDNVPMDDILPSTPQTPNTLKTKSSILSSLSKSATKSIGSKTPPRLMRGASSVLKKTPSKKQPPAMNMPSGEVHSGDTLENYVLPPTLRMDTVDVNAAQGGMEVIKVSKVSHI
jgi:hypothetical protein